MSTSSDGGLTWSSPLNTAADDFGLGGNPVVQPNGTVVVGYSDFNGGMSAFTSSNGGHSWNAAVSISSAPMHGLAGGLRSFGLPSTAIDGAGTVYVSWPDCRFESGCSANDIVFSTSNDGVHWSSVVRVASDPTGSGVDHFIHGMGIDPKTSGSTRPPCGDLLFLPRCRLRKFLHALCRLHAVERRRQDLDGGPASLRGNANQLAAEYPVWLHGGRLRRDGVRRTAGLPALHHCPSAAGGLLQEAVYTEGYGFPFTGQEQTFSSKDDKPIPDFNSYIRPREFYDQDNEFPVHPAKTAPPETG